MYSLVCMHTQPGEKEPFVKLEWAPDILRRLYPPEHLDGEESAASPIVFALRNHLGLYGLKPYWCIGTASWLIVEKGPVIVVGIDWNQALQDAEQPSASPMHLVDRKLSLAGKATADSAIRLRFQVYAATGTALWVPQGSALALFGIAEGGISAVAFFPWLSSTLATINRTSNERNLIRRAFSLAEIDNAECRRRDQQSHDQQSWLRCKADDA
jgi:hypothetical protein